MREHILILGGSSGIGLGAAQRLLERGCVVTLAARNGERLAEAAASLARGGGEIRTCVADGMDADHVAKAITAASDSAGLLQGAVAVPGGAGFAPVTALEPEQLSDELAMNTVPVLNLVKACVPAMSDGGSIVAISSTAAVQSSRGLASYCASKAALEGLLRVAADELGSSGVRINGVRPGLTHTEATSDMFASDEVLAHFQSQIPLGRAGAPGDTAGAISFLLSPDADWVTGQFLGVDGGHTLRAFPDMLGQG